MTFKTLAYAIQVPDLANTVMGTYRSRLQQDLNGQTKGHLQLQIPPHTWAYDVQLDTYIKETAIHNYSTDGSFQSWLNAIAEGTLIESIRSAVAQAPAIILKKHTNEQTIVDALLTFIENNAPIWALPTRSPYEDAEKKHALSILNICFDQDILWDPGHEDLKTNWAMHTVRLPECIEKDIKLNFLVRVIHQPHLYAGTISIGEITHIELNVDDIPDPDFDLPDTLSDLGSELDIEMVYSAETNSSDSDTDASDFDGPIIFTYGASPTPSLSPTNDPTTP